MPVKYDLSLVLLCSWLCMPVITRFYFSQPKKMSPKARKIPDIPYLQKYILLCGRRAIKWRIRVPECHKSLLQNGFLSTHRSSGFTHELSFPVMFISHRCLSAANTVVTSSKLLYCSPLRGVFHHHSSVKNQTNSLMIHIVCVPAAFYRHSLATSLTCWSSTLIVFPTQRYT